MKHHLANQKFPDELLSSETDLKLIAVNLEPVRPQSIFTRIKLFFARPTLAVEDWEKLESHKHHHSSKMRRGPF